MTTPKKGRPRKGSLEFRGKTWRARLTVTVDGESVRKWFDLGTQSRPVARRKLARLQKEHAAGATDTELTAAATRGETVSEAAARILDTREVRDVDNDQIRFRLHVEQHIGRLEVTEVRSSHIRDVLEAGRDAGKSRRTLVHIRRVMNLIFDTLWREELLEQNPVARVKVPGGKSDRRERAVLTDEELARYLAWEHPQEQYQDGVRERQTLACVSRMFGGLRTGDMHALKWESFNVDDGNFSSGWAPRKKTARPQLLAVPEMLRPILRDWWERAGKPTQGLMFPALRGEQAGKGEKTGVSHASAFRRDLRRAFGVEVLAKSRWAKARELTPRERELFEDTEFTRPVDFHSWRRAYSQALAEANVSAQQAQALAGHASLDAHQRYLLNTSKMRELPEAALPQIRVLPLRGANIQELPEATKGKSPDISGLSGLRGLDLNQRPSGYEPDELPDCSTARQF